MKLSRINPVLWLAPLMLLVGFQSASAIPIIRDLGAVWLADYQTHFTAYDYNTYDYDPAPAYHYVGCGPTTGAMILNYFQNHFSATGLMEAGGGLATAQTLHGAAYMRTGLDGAADGFGSPYNIEPGMEGYATSKGHTIDAVIHSSTTVDPGDATWGAYGPYGSSWNNDGIFWEYTGSVWGINDAQFYDYTATRLAAGTPIFLTVDSDGDGGGDHWIPMVGVELGVYYYYNTWDLTLHSATVASAYEGYQTFSITGVRTVEYVSGPGGGGDEEPIPEPGTLVLFGSGLAGLAGLRLRFRK